MSARAWTAPTAVCDPHPIQTAIRIEGLIDDLFDGGNQNAAMQRWNQVEELITAPPPHDVAAVESNTYSLIGYALDKFNQGQLNDVAAPDATPEQTGFAQATTAKIETFEGFNYTVTLGGTNEDNIHFKVDVAANIAKERTPAADEKPEDKEKLDKEHKDKITKLEEKLKNEERFEKWTYLMSKWTVDALLKPRTDFFTEKKAQEKPADEVNKPADSAVPPVPTLPPELTQPIE